MQHRTNLAALLVMTATLSAGAQSATLRVSHDHPTGLVQPGETVQLTILMDWTPSSAVLWRVAGNVNASPNTGLAANPRIAIPFPGGVIPPPGPAGEVWNPGTPSGGSIVGIEVFTGFTNFFGGLVPPPWNITTDFPLIAFDWTAPAAPGASIDFNWQPASGMPMPQFNLNNAAGPIASLPTTYLGTSLTVIPAPATLVALLAPAFALSGRSRK